MAKHPDYVLRNNAIRGAMTTWCPTCDRKSALSASMMGTRKCRYCGAVWRDVDLPPLRREKKRINEPQYVPTVTDELAGALALLLGAVDDTNDLHKVVLKRTAVEVARIALAHYQAQREKGGNK